MRYPNKVSLLFMTFMSMLIQVTVFADTVYLTNSKIIKGLVVEEHEDRILYSTVDGEIPIMRKEIEKIEYTEPSYTLLSIGQEMERNNKLGEALSYYEKALELNPDLEDARRAALGIRSRMWAGAQTGPVDQVEKQQLMEDAWRSNVGFDEQLQQKESSHLKLLQERWGMEIEDQGDWIVIKNVSIGKDAVKNQLRAGDRLVSLDGHSLRYLNLDTVIEKILEPRFAAMTLQIRRVVELEKKPGGYNEQLLGFKLNLEYDGLKVKETQENSIARHMKINEGDMLVEIDDQPTRYLAKQKVTKLMKNSEHKPLRLSFDKTLQLTRK